MLNYSRKALSVALTMAMLIVGTVLAFYTQIPPDLAWHLHVSQGIFETKQRLYQDFFEVNTPLIIYLTYLSVAISYLLKLDYHTGLACFNLVLVGFCFFWCVRDIRGNGFFVFLPFCSYILFLLPFTFPCSEFGQKEHLFIALLLPWILDFSFGRASNYVTIFMAGLGMLIKPFFSFIYLGLLVVKLWEKVPCKREIAVISLMHLCYVLCILQYHPQYFATIVPIANASYAHINHFGSDVMENFLLCWKASIINLAVVLIPLFLAIPIFNLSVVRLLPGLLIAILMTMVQGKFFWYHYIPALSIALVMLAMIMQQYVVLFQQFYSGDRALYFKYHWALVVIIVSIGVISTQTLMVRNNLSQQYFDKLALQELRVVLQHHPGTTVLVLGSYLSPTFMMDSKLKLHWPLKQHSLQILDGVCKIPQTSFSPEQEMVVKYVVEDVLEALAKKPEIVLVQQYHSNLNSKSFAFFLQNHGDYLDFFHAQSFEFTSLWREYESHGNVGNHLIHYQFFKRNASS